MRVLLDATVLAEPLRELPDPAVMEQWEHLEHLLHTASVLIHELSYGVARLLSGRSQQCFSSYLHGLLGSGLTVLPDERKTASWPGQQRARLEIRGLRPPFVDDQIAAIAVTQELVRVTRSARDFALFEGLELLNWLSRA